MDEPIVKRAVAFFDGQNLYRHAKDVFGHHYPSYDPAKLFDALCAREGWKQFGVRFYTGTPSANVTPMWHGFWSNKLLALRRAGVLVYSRQIRYREHDVTLTDGTTQRVVTPQEKGIDIRLALDVMRLALSRQFDVAVLFSQDQDLSELVEDIKEVSRIQDRWIQLACAFPVGPLATTKRGIDKTQWVEMDQTFYDACLDPHDYRPAKFRTAQPPPAPLP